MSGVTILGLREYLAERLGQDALDSVLRQNGMASDLVAQFMSPQLTYSASLAEDVTLGAVHAGMQALGLTMEALVTGLGHFLLPWACERAGYLKHSIHRASSGFVGFARVLNSLIVELYSALGHRRPGLPEAHVCKVTPSSFTVGVFMARSEKIPRYAIVLCMYKGMLQWAAETLYGIEAKFTSLEVTELPSGQLYQSCRVDFPVDLECSDVAASLAPATAPDPAAAPATASLGLDPDSFRELMPFHFALSMDLRVLQAGQGLKSILPSMANTGIHIQDVFSIRVPRVPWTTECLQAVLENDRVTRIILTSPSGIELSGGLHRVRLVRRVGAADVSGGEEALMFMGSPSLGTLGDMQALGLYLSDFPPSDRTADHVLLSTSRQVVAVEALQEAQQSNIALKATLQDALARQRQEAGEPAVAVDSAGHTLLRLLDNLLVGEEVGHEDVLEARNAVLRAGSSLWRPLGLDWNQVADTDLEAAEHLAKLLGSSGQLGTVDWVLPGVPEPAARSGGAAATMGRHSHMHISYDMSPGLPGFHRDSRMSLDPSRGAGGSPATSRRQLVLTGSPRNSIRQHSASTSGAAAAAAAAGAPGLHALQSAGASTGGSGGALNPTRSTPLAASASSRQLALSAHRKRFATTSMGPSHQWATEGTAPPGAVNAPRSYDSSQSSSEGGAHSATPPTSQVLQKPGLAAADSAAAAAAAAGTTESSAANQLGATPMPAVAEAGTCTPAGEGGFFKTMVQAFKGSMFGSGKKKGAARRGTKVLATPGAVGDGAATLIVPLAGGEAAAAASSSPPHRHRPDTANEDKAVPPGKASASQLTDGGSCGSGGSHGTTAAAAAAAGPSGTAQAPGAATPPKTPPLSHSGSPPPRHGPVSGGAIGGGGGGGSTALQVVLAGGQRRLSPLPGAQGTAATGGTPQAPLEQEIKIMFDVTPRVIRVLQQPGNEVATVLRSVDDWQFDAFKLDRVTYGRPLSFLAFHLMNKMGLVTRLRLDANKLARYLMRIEDGYRENPYHCRIHAADVLRSLHVVLNRGGVLSAVTYRSQAEAGTGQEIAMHDYQLFACYLSAVIHDYEHRGVTNDFLIKTHDPLALLYNDMSPHEMHHAAAALSLILRDEYAFMPAISSQTKAVLRKEVVELVLATDMKQHFPLTSSFGVKVVQQLRNRLQAQGSFCTRFSGGNAIEAAAAAAVEESAASTHAAASALKSTSDGWDRETQMLALKMAVKAADLGHLTSYTDVHKNWVARLEEEMFLQGDRERSLGQTVSPLMDRTKAGITKSQCGFFTVVAQPMFKSFSQVFPGAKDLLINLDINYNFWKHESEGASSAGNALTFANNVQASRDGPAPAAESSAGAKSLASPTAANAGVKPAAAPAPAGAVVGSLAAAAPRSRPASGARTGPAPAAVAAQGSAATRANLTPVAPA